MNCFKKFLAISAISFALILAGCQNTQTQTSTESQQSPPEENATQNQDNETKTPKALETFPLADQAAYKGAQNARDASFCEKISNAELQKQCKTDLQDQISMEAAIQASDANLCSKLSTPDKQKACSITIEANMKALKNLQVKEEKNQLMYEEFNKILETKDYTQCQRLDDANLIRACEYSLVSTEAIAQSNPELCSKISDEEARKECTNAVSESTKSTK